MVHRSAGYISRPQVAAPTFAGAQIVHRSRSSQNARSWIHLCVLLRGPTLRDEIGDVAEANVAISHSIVLVMALNLEQVSLVILGFYLLHKHVRVSVQTLTALTNR